MQIKRKEFLNDIKQEMELRETIRHAIHYSETKRLKEEKTLRQIIKNLIVEAKAKDLKVHDTSAGNYLENLVSNTSFLSDLKGGYNTLTTDPAQRKSYAAHILNAMKGLLERDKINRREDDESVAATSLKASPDGGIDFNITDKETRKTRELETEAAAKFEMMPGMDQSGAEQAEETWDRIEPLIVKELKKARNPKDRSTFEEFLIVNTLSYFEEWEGSISSTDMTPEVAL
tara:strand:+ start:487 stop:1179 length:693 start_codon:yes stop_codon:yes gene_type:complete